MERASRQASGPHEVPHRRQALKAITLLVCWPAARRADAAPYPATIAAMQSARETETGVYYHYTEFARRAQADGYRGVAYLFAAFAASELVHATNFGRILAQLNVEVAPIAKPSVRVGTTRDNLIRAANGEMSSIEAFYPKLLEQLRPEGHADAITTVQYAWESEKQHRDKIGQIQRWSGAFFEQVARTIDEKTGRYFICQLCGSTVNTVPAGRCPVCKFPSTHYRGVEPPG
jgi:rubrerythrin